MRVELKRASSGGLLLVVKFEEAKNFDPKNLTWVPKIDEVDLIVDALNAVTGRKEEAQHEREKRGS